MWPDNWRESWWADLSQPWDIVIVGGGIVGAGILRVAAHLGLRVLLVEQRDFSWGTSSRSSKFVHGGLRYLKNGAFGLTYESVRERQRLLREGHGLVTPIGFLLSHYEGEKPGLMATKADLSIYDLMGR